MRIALFSGFATSSALAGTTLVDFGGGGKTGDAKRSGFNAGFAGGLGVVVAFGSE